MIARRVLVFIGSVSMASFWNSGICDAAEFPYTAKISGRNVHVRSGPGTQYYATDKLQISDTVEVYRHDPGGWFAVRPPKGSYSWIAGRFLELVESDDPDVQLAKVTGNRVAARVGGKLAKTRDVIAVRLDRGELVEVLEADESGSKVWYKIAPPSGEFRWIHGRYIERDMTEGAASVSQPKPVPPFKSKAAAAKKIQSPQTTEELPLGQTVKQRSPSTPSQTARPAPPFASQLPQIDSDQAPSAVLPTQQLRMAVDAIDLELSRIVAESPDMWNFDDLQQRTEALLTRCATALDRGHVRLLKNKLDRFAELKRRRDTVGVVMAETDRRHRGLGGTTSVPTTVADRFDGTGTLMPVISKNLETPPFALTDSQSRILTYVSAAPGVNLRAHLGKQVGLTGIRGFAADLNKPHLTAKRVTLLDGTVRR